MLKITKFIISLPHYGYLEKLRKEKQEIINSYEHKLYLISQNSNDEVLTARRDLEKLKMEYDNYK